MATPGMAFKIDKPTRSEGLASSGGAGGEGLASLGGRSVLEARPARRRSPAGPGPPAVLARRRRFVGEGPRSGGLRSWGRAGSWPGRGRPMCCVSHLGGVFLGTRSGGRRPWLCAAGPPELMCRNEFRSLTWRANQAALFVVRRGVASRMPLVRFPRRSAIGRLVGGPPSRRGHLPDACGQLGRGLPEPLALCGRAVSHASVVLQFARSTMAGARLCCCGR